MNANLDNIKQIQNRMSTITDMASFGTGKSVEYRIEKGTCFGLGLFKNEKVAVQKAFMSKDTSFLPHIHKDETEIIIVYQGTGEYYKDDKVYSYKPKSIIVFDPGVVHSFKSHTDTWMIGVTIPAEEGYPHAG